MAKKKKSQDAHDEAKKAKSSQTIGVLHEDPLREPALITHDAAYMTQTKELKRNYTRRSAIAYGCAAASAAVMALICARTIRTSRVVEDATEATSVRTVALAKSVPADEVVDADIHVVKDAKGRPTIALRLSPKTATTYDVRLKVSAVIKGISPDGDEYEQTVKDLECDSPDQGIFSRDGIVQIQSLTTVRNITLWPSFDDVHVKGELKSLKHIDVEVTDAVESAGVVDAIPPEACNVRANMTEDGIQITGSVENPCDVTMHDVNVILTTIDVHGDCPPSEGREDVPWAYGGVQIRVPIGDLAIGQTKNINEVIDVSKYSVTRAHVQSVVASAR